VRANRLNVQPPQAQGLRRGHGERVLRCAQDKLASEPKLLTGHRLKKQKTRPDTDGARLGSSRMFESDADGQGSPRYVGATLTSV